MKAAATAAIPPATRLNLDAEAAPGTSAAPDADDPPAM